MPFRAADYVHLCESCKATTTSGCLRCGKPLCTSHLPDAHHRCAECEAEYELHRRPMISADALKPSAPPQQSNRWPWLLLTGNVVVALSFWLPADVFFAMLLVGPMLLLAALESTRSFAEQVLKHRQFQERQARRAFMAERKLAEHVEQRRAPEFRKAS